MNRLAVNPELITWARERAGLDALDLTGRFPKLPEWGGGELQPTLRQLEDFARAFHAPIGYLFLPGPRACPHVAWLRATHRQARRRAELLPVLR